MKKVLVYNLPKDEDLKEYTVARKNYSDYWWYLTTTDDIEIAIDVAHKNNGLIFHRDWMDGHHKY